MTHVDEKMFMRRALELAQKGRAQVSPNPMVGAVLVKNGKIIAEGYHRKVGGHHAEVDALNKLPVQKINGATLYATLEPCSHFGRTPPCCDFLIEKGIKEIVVAMADPNPLVAGKGIKNLRKAGIKVRVGLLHKEAQKLNEAFIYSIQTRLPFILWKSAFTIDGKIATASGDSKWISNDKSRYFVHQLRSTVDAILTSSSTVLADDPHLGARIPNGRDPLRIVIDSTLRTPLSAQVYRDRNVIVATTASVFEVKKKKFKKREIELLIYKGKKVPLKKLFLDLYSRGIGRIMVEAGSSLGTALLKEGLIQKVYFFIAPKIIGSDGINFIDKLGINKVKNAISFKNIESKSFDDDIMIVGYF